MIEYFRYGPGEGPEDDFFQFVKDSDAFFNPPLSVRVNVEEYAKKMFLNGTKQWFADNGKIIALSVAYYNKPPQESFGTYLFVLPEYESNGLGLKLVQNTLKYLKEFGADRYRVKIRASNKMLYKFYLLMGFKKTGEGLFPNTDEVEYELTKFF